VIDLTNNKRGSEKGFTLIEMLIVLFIVFSATGIALISFQKLQEHKQTEYFLEQFKEDLYFAQEYALSRHKTIDVHFYPEEYRYTVGPSAGPIILNRKYNKKITVDAHVFANLFRYKSNGNVSRFGTIKIKTAATEYLLTFHIGKGRFQIEEQ
jgi:competence protein ComGD